MVFDCPGNSSAPEGSASASACVCDTRFSGVNGEMCSFCDMGYYCPGGAARFQCGTNEISPKGSFSLSNCTCLQGYALLLNEVCQILEQPQIVGTGTVGLSGSYVGMVRVKITPPENSDVAYVTGNDTLTCASAVSNLGTFVFFETTEVSALACSLNGVESFQNQSFDVTPGATVKYSFAMNKNVNKRNFGKAFGKELSKKFNTPEDQIRVNAKDAPGRRLLATTVDASIVSSSQAEFDALTTQASSFTEADLTALVRASTGDNTISASGLVTEVIAGELTNTATPKPTPGSSGGADVGTIVAISVVCGLLVLSTILFVAYRIYLSNVNQSYGHQTGSNLVYADVAAYPPDQPKPDPYSQAPVPWMDPMAQGSAFPMQMQPFHGSAYPSSVPPMPQITHGSAYPSSIPPMAPMPGSAFPSSAAPFHSKYPTDTPFQI